MLPLAAHALEERAWLMLSGGAGTYVMSDLNDEIDYTNTNFGWNLARVRQGRALGATVGFETAGRWNLGLGLDRLDAATRTSDASGAVEWRFDANAWRVFADYALRPIGRSTLFAGGAIGLVQENGKFIVSQTGFAPYENPITGGAPLYEGYAGGNWWISRRLAVTAIGGYRYARIKEIAVHGIPLLMSNGERLSLDFSGPTVRLGVKLAAPLDR